MRSKKYTKAMQAAKPAAPPMQTKGRKPPVTEKLLDELYSGDNRGQSFLGIFVPSGLLVLAALLLTLFAAVTFASTGNTMKTSESNAVYCNQYYEAETIATQILTDFWENKSWNTADANSKLIHNSPKGDITVFRSDNTIFFTVPIDEKGRESLSVMAKVTDAGVNLIQWTIV